MFETLILNWGYLALGIGTLLEGETVLIAAGAMAHKGLMSLPLVITIAIIGGFTGDLIWYFIGHRYGKPFIDKRPKLQRSVSKIQRLLDRYGALFVFSFRFIYGLRTVSPVILGVARYPLKKYVALNALGATVWGIVFAYVGWGLGLGFREMLSRHPHLEEVLGIAVAVTLILWVLEKVYAHFREKSLIGTETSRFDEIK